MGYANYNIVAAGRDCALRKPNACMELATHRRLSPEGGFNWRFAMAETIDVQVTGKSEAEIAHNMAREILISVESKSLKQITRSEYLNTHVDAILALRGSRPDK